MMFKLRISKVSSNTSRRGTFGLAIGSALGFAFSPSSVQSSNRTVDTDKMITIPGRIAGSTPVPVRRNYLSGQYGQIHFRIAQPLIKTNKRPVICLHMSPNSSRVYERFMGFLGTDRLCIAPDTPGFGDSDPPFQQPLIEDYASELGKFIENLNLDSVDLIGYHTGSETCVELGHQYPDKISRIAIISAPIFNESEREDHKNQFALLEPLQDGSHLAQKWVSHTKWRMAGWSLDHLAYQFNDALRNPDISWWGHSAAFEYEMEQKLKDTSKEVLVLNPEDDLVNYTNRAKNISPRVKVLDLPGWNHGFLDLNPEETVQILRKFYDDVG